MTRTVPKHTTRRLHGLRERYTAIHEAGHAVAAFYLRHRVRKVTIVPTGDALGHVRHNPIMFAKQGVFDDSLRGIARAETRIIILYAGPIAHRRFRPKSPWKLGGTSDFDLASKLMSHLEGPDYKCNRLYDRLLWRRAELLVDLRWRDINAVAKALLRHRTLNAREVNAAIDRAHGFKPVSVRHK
jgi:hypothetical protein